MSLERSGIVSWNRLARALVGAAPLTDHSADGGERTRHVEDAAWGL